MSDQQHGRPAAEASDASAGREPGDLGPAAPADGSSPSQLAEALKGRPKGEARDAIERATAVVGDDAGDAS